MEDVLQGCGDACGSFCTAYYFFCLGLKGAVAPPQMTPLKSPLNTFGIVAVGIVRESRKFSGNPCIGRIARSSLRWHCFLVFYMTSYFQDMHMHMHIIALAKRELSTVNANSRPAGYSGGRPMLSISQFTAAGGSIADPDPPAAVPNSLVHSYYLLLL